MEIERAFRMPLEDPNWPVKVLIGGGILLIPIVNLLSAGYALEVMRRTIGGTPEMPAWDDWGDKFVKGLVSLVIGFLYFLPATLIMAIGSGLGVVAGGWGVPGMAAMAGGFVLGSLLMLLIGFFVPMALAHYVATGSFSAAFALSTIIDKIGKNIGDYVVAYVLALVIFALVSLIAGIPFIGWLVSIFAYFYGLIVMAVLFGGVYVRS